AFWKWADFSESWQFQSGWKPGATTFLTDTGDSRPFKDLAGDLDFDASKVADPGNTGAGAKSTFRPNVASASADKTSVKAEATVQITVTLAREARAPNGALVLLRCDSPHLIVPSSVRVKGKKKTATVTATAAVGSPAGSAKIE